MKNTIEQRAADTLLQRSAKVTVCGIEFEAAAPSIATLVLVSEAVAKLPGRRLDANNIVAECLAVAKDCRILGDVAAILILGARHINDTMPTTQSGRNGFLNRFIPKRNVKKREWLSHNIMETYTPTELHGMIAMLLQRLDLADFFALTTFLSEVNLLKETKVEKTRTTASGQ